MLFRPVMFMAALLVAGAAAPLAAQPPMPAIWANMPDAHLDAAARADIVGRFATALRQRYVFPDVGAAAAARIEAALARGDYGDLAAPGAFAAKLSADAEAVAHDTHLRVWSNAAPPPPPAAQQQLPPSEGNITRADRLAGGIGYIEVVGFPPPEPFRRVLDRAMAGLAGSRALIVDVRRNNGGFPESVAYLASFLLAPGQALSGIVMRVENTADFRHQRLASVATPVRFADVPVFILTSANSFSGAEAFAYDLQALKRGTVIGETTGGGANPTGPVDLGHGVVALVPFGRAENPVTGSNWEGRGVKPDIAVPAAEALATALERAGQARVATIEAASQARVFTPRTTPLPGSEAALRAVLAGYASGKPDYAALAPMQAEMTRQQLPMLQRLFGELGALQTARFLGPDMAGGDQYALHFEHGDRMMGLVLGPDGKVQAVSTPMAMAAPAAAPTP